jgi:nicotinate-nucleotide pyrophosphorylase (carboxylating)
MRVLLNITDSLQTLLRMALQEDIGTGDITSTATVDYEKQGFGYILTKADGIFSGRTIFEMIFQMVDPDIDFIWFVQDGEAVHNKQKCVEFKGRLHNILIAERTGLNFMQRMSGIATLTFQFSQLIRHTQARIIDTRKTTPLWREIEKYAVRCGGGSNHRMGLYDMFLIKDNHIASSGGITVAIQKAIEYNKHHTPVKPIEVETKNIDEVKKALRYPVQRIMLDNMSVKEMKTAVEIISGRCEVEASGGVTIATVRAIAETGVDFISVGALTHSAPALDLSLLIDSSK